MESHSLSVSLNGQPDLIAEQISNRVPSGTYGGVMLESLLIDRDRTGGAFVGFGYFDHPQMFA